MDKLTQRLAALRESMRDADGNDSDSFTNVFNAFLGITETSNLVAVSMPFKDRRIRLMVDNVARKHAADPKSALESLQMLHHRPSGLVHGMFFAGFYPGSFFWFLQEKQGIVALVESLSMTHLYRVTAAELPAVGFFAGRRSAWKN